MLPSGTACLRFNIDATRIGNIARFFNHRLDRCMCFNLSFKRQTFCMSLCSCDGGNLELKIKRSRGSPLPHVAMFASRDINVGDEITFSYGASIGEVQPDVASDPGNDTASRTAAVKLAGQRQRCYCQSEKCHGFLPCC